MYWILKGKRWQQHYCFYMFSFSSHFNFRDVNTTIMELLIMVYACRTSCARNIIGVIPYFPYSKQCKMRKRGSIVSKLLASMMCKAGKAAGFICVLSSPLQPHYCIPTFILADAHCNAALVILYSVCLVFLTQVWLISSLWICIRRKFKASLTFL